MTGVQTCALPILEIEMQSYVCTGREGGGTGVVLLQLVQVVVKSWDALFQALAFAGVSNDLRGFGGRLGGVALQDLPVVKHTLGERLAPGVGAEVSGET